METSGHALIALMNNTLTATVTEHVKAKTLTDELVALAPMISYNFWLNCTQSYAMQLIESGHPLKAVLHLLAIHEVRQILAFTSFYVGLSITSSI